MTTPPHRPKIYHIVHVDNLAGIVQEGGLLSDREILAHGGPQRTIGLSEIKRRRVNELDVECQPGTKVGDYVPFYFCPRSIMLFVIHCANHPELDYRGGQEPIVHLEADLYVVVEWAEARRIRWAFSLSNAGAYYTEFRRSVEELNRLDWVAIAARDFRSPDVKEGKQAEFLLHERFPFDLIERIGVRSTVIQERATAAIADARDRPVIKVRRDWYF